MTADPRELSRLSTFYVAADGHDLRAAFVIDGRTYSDPGAVLADLMAAFDELQRHRLVAEVITERVRPDTPASGLPSWEDYRRRL